VHARARVRGHPRCARRHALHAVRRARRHGCRRRRQRSRDGQHESEARAARAGHRIPSGHRSRRRRSRAASRR
jgi:hypothetical protein